jgi:glutamine amidotransferase
MSGAGSRPRVAVVDYGMGNLYSVRQACDAAGLDAALTSDPAEVRAADGVVLPGIGAFEGAIRALRVQGLVEPLQEAAASGRPMVGICLGMQLMMEESLEFGRHEGLGLFKGRVLPFPAISADGRRWKIPQVGWNRVRLQRPEAAGTWAAGGLDEGDFMYFVHSFYVEPADPAVVVATAEYAGMEFCAALGRGNVLAWQFHPERSADRGLALYKVFADRVRGQ